MLSTPATEIASPYIEVQNIHKTFDNRAAVAIKSVSVAIPKGAFVSIVGPSGCGKSTLLQIIAGLVPPTSGAVQLHGRSIVEPVPEMIYVFQQYAKSIFPWKTVLQNTQFGLRYRSGLVQQDQLEACRNMLALVGLEGRDNSYPYQLSGGMQQRVALARALVCRPDVLLMDEPFSAIDAITKAELQDLVLRIWREFGLTVLFVTHDLDEALYLSERILVLSKAPAVTVQDVTVDLPYPRDHLTTRSQPRFLEYRKSLYGYLKGR